MSVVLHDDRLTLVALYSLLLLLPRHLRTGMMMVTLMVMMMMRIRMLALPVMRR